MGGPRRALQEKDNSLSNKIIRNALFGGLRSILVAPVPFLLTPLILRKIGAAGYGTWAIFQAINGMTSLADLGMVGALSKFVAEHHARQDRVALSRLISTGLVAFGILSLTVTGILWAGTGPAVSVLFGGSPIEKSQLATLFRCFLAVVGVNVLTLLFSSITTGLQRLDLTNVMNAFNILFGAIVGGVLLIRGWGLRGLVYAQICGALLTLLGYLVLVRKLLPAAKLNPAHFHITEAKRIFGFSLRLYFTQAAVAVHNNIEKLLLGLFVGVTAAGWYDIANEVALKIRGAIGLMLGPVMPAASELGAVGDERRLSELYFRAHKYLAFVGVPVACFMAGAAPRFVNLWIGPTFKIVALPLSVLVFVNFFNLMTGPGFLIFAGNGNLRPGIRSATLGILLNVVISSLLIPRFGFPGAVVGTTLAMTIASLYFMYLFHAETEHSVTRLLRESYTRPIACSVLLIGGLFLIRRASDLSWTGLALQALLSAALYVLALLFSRFFDHYDWAKIEGFFPVMRHARRIVRIA